MLRDMATPKPGEIRCPTCHRSTPPAGFCTQCGTAIPPDARIRPRGMDRDELQDRIRARRSGADPYRRGGVADEPGYERYEPDPNDARARGGEPAADRRIDHFDEARPTPLPTPQAAPPPPPDITRDTDVDEWRRADAPGREEPHDAGDVAAAHRELEEEPAPAPPTYVQPPADEPPRYVDNYDDGYDGTYDDVDEYDYPYERERDRRPGAGAFAILGFLALGVLALLGGAVLAGVFSEDPGVGQASPTPSASVAPSLTPSVDPTGSPADGSPAPGGSPGTGGSPPPTDGPVTFPDGFVGDVEPCATSEMGFEGCVEDGSTVSGDAMWTWIGFDRARGDDVLVLSLQSDGQTISQQERVMSESVSCPDTCAGYLIQGFRGLAPGTYSLLLERNGEFADQAAFTVQ